MVDNKRPVLQVLKSKVVAESESGKKGGTYKAKVVVNNKRPVLQVLKSKVVAASGFGRLISTWSRLLVEMRLKLHVVINPVEVARGVVCVEAARGSWKAV